MKNRQMKVIQRLGIHVFCTRLLLLALVATSLSACVGLGGRFPKFLPDSWQEEVLLHDGQRLIVERSQTYGGGQSISGFVTPRTQTIRFKLPNDARTISWTSEYSEDLGRTDFNPLALHIKQGTPYFIVEPNLCLSYNKWGRPNPPYVIFKWEANAWNRVSMAELPAEFTTINLVVVGWNEEVKENSRAKGYIPVETVMKMNDKLGQSQFRSILRRAMPVAPCPKYSSGFSAPD